MTPLPSWHYDEFRQVGRDYSSPREVAVYDSSHAGFRDIEAEAAAVLDRLGLVPGQVIVDLGSGTGTFAIHAARRGIRVVAADVSPAMLGHARAKAVAAGVGDSIEFVHAGFLTLERGEGSVDAITSTFAFHHLPDFWKGVALERLHGMLEPGGQLHLRDVVIGAEHAVENIGVFIEAQARAGGAFLRADAEGHFRDEYSTYDWVMEGLLARAGFTILGKELSHGVLGTYFCAKGA